MQNYRVAATKSPIIFIGTGEHIHDLEAFSAKSFISKMLGLGDSAALQETMENLEKQVDPDMMKRLEGGEFSFSDFKAQIKMIMGLGPLSSLFSMLPGGMGGMADMMKKSGMEETGGNKMKRMVHIMDSMTAKGRSIQSHYFNPY